jgi:replicative DNA helicase
MKIHANNELERRLLSSLLFGPEEVFAAVNDGLCSEAFFNLTNRSIWKAIAATAAEDRSTDIVSVWRRLSGLDGDSPTLSDFSNLDGLEPTSLRRSSLTSDVIGLWKQRRLQESLQKAQESASADADNWKSVWESTEPHLRLALSTSSDTHHRSLQSIADSASDYILNGDKRSSISSGLLTWDKEAGSPRSGELVIIAGRPGSGKTALAVQIALLNALHHGDTTAFFSLEMTAQEIIIRMAAHSAGRSSIFDPKSRAPHAKALGALKTLQIFDGVDSSTLSQIEARSRLIASNPAGLRLIVIDYLQLITPSPETRKDNRERQVAELSRRLKLLAIELSCPIFVLAQLNRESEKDSRRPRLSDLRESGAIEQDADRVWFLYPDSSQPNYMEDSAEIDIILYQAKCRNGTPGIVSNLKFLRPCSTFFKP